MVRESVNLVQWYLEQKTHYHIYLRSRGDLKIIVIFVLQTDCFFVCFCSEHDKELEALQAAFEQAICHLSKSTCMAQLWNRQCFAVSCSISVLFSWKACIQQNVLVSQIIVWCWWWCFSCVSHLQHVQLNLFKCKYQWLSLTFNARFHLQHLMISVVWQSQQYLGLSTSTVIYTSQLRNLQMIVSHYVESF